MVQPSRQWRRRLSLGALAVLVLQIGSWSVWGRQRLPQLVPTVIEGDVREFHRLVRQRWPSRTPTTAFGELALEAGAIPLEARRRLRTTLAAQGIRLVEPALSHSPGSRAHAFSFNVTINTPFLGTITSSYSAAGAGLSMRTRFGFILGAWVPFQTTQLSVS